MKVNANQMSALPLSANLWIVPLCLLLGAVLALPMGLPAVIGACFLLVFVTFCVHRPDTAFSLSVGMLIVLPQYLFLMLPGVPALPLSLGPWGVLAGILIVRALISREPLKRPESILVTMFSIYGLALFLSVFVGGDKDSLMLFVRTYLLPLLLFFTTLYYARNSKQAMRAMNTLLIAACIAALYAALEFALKKNYLLEKLVMEADVDPSFKAAMSMFYQGEDAFSEQSLIYRCFSFFTNPLEHGTFMTMIFPFPLIHAVSASTASERRRYGLAALICALGIILSFSRGPILAMVLSTIGMAVFVPKLRRIVGFSLVAIMLSVAALWPVIGDRIQSRLNEIDNVTVRFKLWESGAHMFADHPLFGVGLSQYAKHEDETIRVHGIGPFYEYGGSIEKIATVDNHLIQLAAETGLVGMLAYLSLLGFLFHALYQVWQRHQNAFARNTAMALAAGVGNYLFNGLTITSYVLFVITMIFTFFIAVTASLDAEVTQ